MCHTKLKLRNPNCGRAKTGEDERKNVEGKKGEEGGGCRNGAAVSYVPCAAAFTNCAECTVHTEREQNGVWHHSLSLTLHHVMRTDGKRYFG